MDAKKMIKKAAARCRTSIGWHIDNWILVPRASGFAKRRWEKAIRDPSFCGLSKKKRKEPLIVSLTSFPPRIECVSETIKTLLIQTMKPDMILLWLAEEEFPGKEADLPDRLKELVPYGLSIRWCHNDRSYKKLIPTLEAYPEAVIITVDDDTIYHPDLIRRLFSEYLENGRKKIIYCHRATMIEMDEGKLKVTTGGYVIHEYPSYLNRPTGVGGILYPPHCLDPEVVKRDLYMTLASMNDDVWFWAMAVRNGTYIKALKHRITMIPKVEGSQIVSLVSVNSVEQEDGQDQTMKQMLSVLEHYPEIRARLEEEWRQKKA